MRTALLIAILSIVCLSVRGAENVWVSRAPSRDAYTHIDPKGTTVIPNGRLLTPRGRQITVAPHPYGLVLSPDGSTAVTANSGIRPFSVTVIHDLLGESPTVRQIPEGYRNDKGILASVYMGLAITPDNSLLYVAGGQEGAVFLFDLKSKARIGMINCDTTINGQQFADSYIGDMVLNKDGSLLYAVDQMNFRVIVIDMRSRTIAGSVGVGRYPFGITLSPDGKRAYVANVGMFAYKQVASLDTSRLNETALERPPFGYLTKEMREGIDTDSIKIPGLGDPNAPESFSVWTLDITKPTKPVVTARIKTGFLVGGSHKPLRVRQQRHQ
jgi:YVTN family beta-propeller protein